MSKNYSLSIITPMGEVLSRPVESLIAPGQYGRIGVMANHAPMIVALRIGILAVRHDDTWSYFAIGEGVLEVSPDEVLILADEAVPAKNEQEARDKERELVEAY